MSFIAEIAIAVVAFLAQASIHIAIIAWRPVRFLYSQPFRTKFLLTKRQSPLRFYSELFGGFLAIVALFGAVLFWTFFFTAEKRESRFQDYDTKALEWIQDHIKSTDSAEQGAAANPYPLRSWGCADPPPAVNHQYPQTARSGWQSLTLAHEIQNRSIQSFLLRGDILIHGSRELGGSGSYRRNREHKN